MNREEQQDQNQRKGKWVGKMNERVWEGGTRNVEVATSRTVCIAGRDERDSGHDQNNRERELEITTHAGKANQVSDMENRMG